jgi:hypothetical protein
MLPATPAILLHFEFRLQRFLIALRVIVLLFAHRAHELDHVILGHRVG